MVFCFLRGVKVDNQDCDCDGKLRRVGVLRDRQKRRKLWE